jgi:hypothetical protein
VVFGGVRMSDISMRMDLLNARIRIAELEEALQDLIEVAGQCNGWESFPSDAMRAADDALGEQK